MAKPPLKASPAPVVSTTGPAETAGTSSERAGPVQQRALRPERDHRAPRAARDQPLGRRARRPRRPRPASPVSAAASVSFGVT